MKYIIQAAGFNQNQSRGFFYIKGGRENRASIIAYKNTREEREKTQ
jgi:hypothetical protein